MQLVIHYFRLQASYLVVISGLLVACAGCNYVRVEKNTVQPSLSVQAISTAMQESSYTFGTLFPVPNPENQQGLAFGEGFHFTAFDIGNGYSRIIQYDSSGTELKRTGSLKMGHSAEVSYRQANGHLYVVNGADSLTRVFEVDMHQATPTILRTLNFSKLGPSGLVAVDNSNGRLVVFAGPSGGPYTVATADFNGTILNKFSLTGSSNLPQGLEVIGNEILFYTSRKDGKSNNIAVYSTTGTMLYSIPVPIANEGEGLSVDEASKTVFVGTHYPNKVYKMSPVFLSDALLGMNLILNPNAEGGAGGTGTTMNVPFWTATGTTVIRYGTQNKPGPSSPGSPNRRSNFFAGGAAESGTLTQQVNVSNLSADIDAGALSYSLNGWLGGYSSENDNAVVTATFLSSNSLPLGVATIGPVLASDRNSITGMLQRTMADIIPPGTRSISVVITMTKTDGTTCDGFADDLSLIITKS